MKGKKKGTNNKSLLIVGGILLVIVVGIVVANLILKGNESKSQYAKMNVCGYGCDTCRSNGTCTKCMNGYTLQGGKCVSMPCQINNCAKCSSPNYCTSCKNGYSLIGNKCVKCKDNKCTSCSSDGNTCYKCSSNFYVDSGKCEYCGGNNVVANNGTRCCTKIANCSVYDGNCKCKKCTNGYTSDGNTCKKCPTGCTACEPTRGYCSACQSGYTLTTMGGAQICIKSTQTYSCTEDNYNRPVEFCRARGYKEGKASCTKVYKALLATCRPFAIDYKWYIDSSVEEDVRGNCTPKVKLYSKCSSSERGKKAIYDCKLTGFNGTITCTMN